MDMGLNRAHIKQTILFQYDAFKGDCIFISYQYTDVKIARKLAEIIMDSGIDVYLDDLPDGMLGAERKRNPDVLMSCIELGIRKSSHLLQLVSDKKHYAWWEAYVRGYARGRGMETKALFLHGGEASSEENRGFDEKERLHDATEFEAYLKGVYGGWRAEAEELHYDYKERNLFSYRQRREVEELMRS